MIVWRVCSDCSASQRLRIENLSRIEETERFNFDIVLLKDGAFKKGYLGGVSHGVIEDGLIKFRARYPNLEDDECLQYVVIENLMIESKYQSVAGCFRGVMSREELALDLEGPGTKVALCLLTPKAEKSDF